MKRKLEVLRKSRWLESQYPGGGNYRFVTCKDLVTGETVVFTINKKDMPRDYQAYRHREYGGYENDVQGRFAPEALLIFSHIEVEYKRERSDEWVEMDDRFLRPIGLIPPKVRITGVQEIHKVGHRRIRVEYEIPLSECTFGNGWVRHNGTGVWLPDTLFDFDFTYLLNRLQPVEGVISLRAWAIVKMSRDSQTGQWEAKQFFDEEAVDAPKSGIEVLNYDFEKMRAAFRQLQISDAYERLLAEIHRELQEERRMVSAQRVLELWGQIAQGEELPESAEDILRGATMRPDYQVEYYEALDELKDEDSYVYFGASGFLFTINGKRVWEVPKAGHATYTFDDSLPIDKLAQRLEVTPRLNILQSHELQRVLGYIGRAIHPIKPDSESDNGETDEARKQRWLNDIKKLVKE